MSEKTCSSDEPSGQNSLTFITSNLLKKNEKISK